MLLVALTPERIGGVFVFFCFCSGGGRVVKRLIYKDILHLPL